MCWMTNAWFSQYWCILKYLRKRIQERGEWLFLAVERNLNWHTLTSRLLHEQMTKKTLKNYTFSAPTCNARLSCWSHPPSPIKFAWQWCLDGIWWSSLTGMIIRRWASGSVGHHRLADKNSSPTVWGGNAIRRLLVRQTGWLSFFVFAVLNLTFGPSYPKQAEAFRDMSTCPAQTLWWV